MKKVEATLGNIMNLDTAAITVNNRLTALRTSHSQRLTAKVPVFTVRLINLFIVDYCKETAVVQWLPLPWKLCF